eukprot:tig00000403_g345.t1
MRYVSCYSPPWSFRPLPRWAGNVGDSRCVLCRSGRPVEMSEDHRPQTRKDELERIERGGGWMDERGMVLGYIAMSRALGELCLKSHVPSRANPLPALGLLPALELLSALASSANFGGRVQDYREGCFPNERLGPEVMISTPEVRETTLTEEDEFLLLCTDGVWNRLSSKEAVSVARAALLRTGSPSDAARAVCERAYACRSTDNATAVVVCFRSFSGAATLSPP